MISLQVKQGLQLDFQCSVPGLPAGAAGRGTGNQRNLTQALEDRDLDNIMLL